jgi:hypothetical protein
VAAMGWQALRPPWRLRVPHLFDVGAYWKLLALARISHRPRFGGCIRRPVPSRGTEDLIRGAQGARSTELDRLKWRSE